MIEPAKPRAPGAASPFAIFLGLVMIAFVALLVYTWVAAEKARPVILDEKGRPRNAR